MAKKLAIGALIFVALILFVLTVLPALPNLARADFATPSSDWYDALIWLKENTPQDTVILAWWDYGYWIEYVAEREAYINPSQQLDRIVEVSKILVDYYSPLIPEGINYLVIDKSTVVDFMPAIVNWAGYPVESIAENKTLARRLFMGEYVKGYQLAFRNNEVRIYSGN